MVNWGSGSRDQAQMLANRVKKRLKHLKKWAKRLNIEAFRLYDRDIPEIPLVLDLYGDVISGALYKRPYEKDPAQEAVWLESMRGALSQSTGIAPENIIIKQRERQRDNSQYEKAGNRGLVREIREGAYKFKVNLSDYLDTGLFLDRRALRAMVGAAARGKRVLNLFCYTASFSVCAAGGGAASVDSVDLSNTYLAWARENFALNNMKAQRGRPGTGEQRLGDWGLGNKRNAIHASSDSIHTMSDTIHAASDSIHTTSDSIHTVSDNLRAAEQGIEAGGDNIHAVSDSIHTRSDNNHADSDSIQAMSDNHAGSDNIHARSDSIHTASDSVHAVSDNNWLIRADVNVFLDWAAKERCSWDLIILDPPAFSNSAMARADFDLARDCPALLAKCLALLSPGGTLWFSASARSFRTSAAELERTLCGKFPGVKASDISAKLVDEDFKGRKAPRTFVIGSGEIPTL